MSDIGPISAPMKPQDTTIFLLGQLTEGIKAIREGQAASQLQQTERDAKNERDHDEFRHTDTEHAKMLAVLMDNKVEARESKRQTVQKWLAYLAIPTSVVGSAASYILGQINHP